MKPDADQTKENKPPKISPKRFEERFRKDWVRTFPYSIILRIPDQMSRFKGSSKNICDFIEYREGILYFTECKIHKGSSLPIKNITQYELMKDYCGMKGVRVGVVLWLYEKDLEFYIPISTIKQMKAEGKKSVGLKAYNAGYNIKLIPTKKKRVFLEADYSILSELSEGE